MVIHPDSKECVRHWDQVERLWKYPKWKVIMHEQDGLTVLIIWLVVCMFLFVCSFVFCFLFLNDYLHQSQLGQGSL